MPERQKVDLAVDELVDQGVSAHHVIDRLAIERFARTVEMRIDIREMRLLAAMPRSRAGREQVLPDPIAARRLRRSFAA